MEERFSSNVVVIIHKQKDRKLAFQLIGVFS